MDMSKFRSVMGSLSFIKRYSSLLIPVVIVVVSLLLFVPTQLLSSSLLKQIESESISKRARKVESLGKSVISREQAEVEKRYQQAYEGDANQIALLSKQTSQQELLSYKLFPSVSDTSSFVFNEFGQRFRSGIDRMLSRTVASDCPTEDELERSLRKTTTQGPRTGRGSGYSNLQGTEATIVDVLCREKANAASVYANPADLSGYVFWEGYEYVSMESAAEDCWYWQLAYWIIEDVVDTVGALNAGSDSVYTSPVKRLMYVSFGKNIGTSGQRGKVVDNTRPSYVYSVQGGLVTPLTQRFSDKDIDVVHFNVAAIVTNKTVLPFMRELCVAKEHKFRGFSGEEPEQSFKHNQITVLQSSVTSINREDDEHNFYRYGEDAVVELKLICEYIFNKTGYDEIKPESVKKTAEDKGGRK